MPVNHSQLTGDAHVKPSEAATFGPGGPPRHSVRRAAASRGRMAAMTGRDTDITVREIFALPDSDMMTLPTAAGLQAAVPASLSRADHDFIAHFGMWRVADMTANNIAEYRADLEARRWMRIVVAAPDGSVATSKPVRFRSDLVAPLDTPVRKLGRDGREQIWTHAALWSGRAERYARVVAELTPIYSPRSINARLARVRNVFRQAVNAGLLSEQIFHLCWD